MAKNILFICTANSARSILAEALTNAIGGGRFRAFSAGSHPRGAVQPLVLEALEQKGIPTAGLRSKSWDEFAKPGAPSIDLVVTVCDHAAGETCPLFPGHPSREHWSIPDPAAVTGSGEEQRRAYAATLDNLQARITALVQKEAQ
jgi:arsenate reductase